MYTACRVMLTKIFLCPSPVEVDPDLPRSIVADAGILLIVKTIKSSTHSIVQLEIYMYIYNISDNIIILL